MTYRVMDLKLVSASDLKRVTLFSRMRVYVVASISGSDIPMPMHSTNADRNGGRNPVWNTVLQFPVPAVADNRGLALHVMLRSQRAFGGHRDVGEVFIPLNDLLAGAHEGGEPKPASYQVRRPMSGRAHGVLYFSYKFTNVKPAPDTFDVTYVKDSEKAMENAMAPVPAYPPPNAAYPSSNAVAMAYPPVVPYGAPYVGYPPVQPYGYAAPPPASSYGYPAQQPSRKGGGMGLGLGLLGGAVGGMMLGEMVGDAEADAAYDAGFNDGLEL
ncbi:hypothetical protein ABZP36_016607 [Zizania latifolia]